MRNIALLGATGSIGKQTLEVIKENNCANIIALSCNKNIKDLEESIVCFKPKYVYVSSSNDRRYLGEKYKDLIVLDDLIDLVRLDEIDTVLNALVGSIGTVCTIEAIKAKKDVLLANKESLVLAGDIINSLVKENKVNLFPIDSEHSAIYQLLENNSIDDIDSIIITASGGSLRNKTREELKDASVSEVLTHPNWSMGSKITIDSATMVNKGLEVIEAHYLFNVDYDNIKTVLHYESSVHGAIRFKDGTVIMHAGPTDMKLPIQYALTYPNRLKCNTSNCFDLTKSFNLTFKEMDFERFPMLKLAYEVGKLKGIMPAVYSMANEVAVQLFLEGKIKFLDIESIIQKECDLYKEENIKDATLEDILRVVDEIKSKYIY